MQKKLIEKLENDKKNIEKLLIKLYDIEDDIDTVNLIDNETIDMQTDYVNMQIGIFKDSYKVLKRLTQDRFDALVEILSRLNKR